MDEISGRSDMMMVMLLLRLMVCYDDQYSYYARQRAGRGLLGHAISQLGANIRSSPLYLLDIVPVGQDLKFKKSQRK